MLYFGGNVAKKINFMPSKTVFKSRRSMQNKQYDVILIKGATVYLPENIGKKDILIAGGVIVALADEIDPGTIEGIKITDANGLLAVPGLIDAHVHIAGAGGEGGPATRTPELQLTDYTTAGVTTVVGCLGTDGITRSVESVLMKAKALRAEGITTYIYTGAYQVPVVTITGDAARDLALVEEVIGVGEVAISDHRSSVPSTGELIRLTAQARVGGMLGHKAGIVNLHMGDARNPFDPIHQAVAQSELTYKQFLPTHCNRNEWIFEESKNYGKQGWIDLTTSSYPYFPDEEIKPSTAFRLLIEAGVPAAHITFTSDAGGSLPGFDPVTGQLNRMVTATPHSNLIEIADIVHNEAIPLETALLPSTVNPATILKLSHKGKLAVGCDADLLLLHTDLTLHSTMARGRWMVMDGEPVVKGYFE